MSQSAAAPGETSASTAAAEPGTAPADASSAAEPVTIPKKPAAIKTKTKKNRVTVSWRALKKKQKALAAKIKGIQVQYATDPGFQNSVTKKVGRKKTKITLKLKKKTTYYIRVRYVGSDGVSEWSGVKKVKTR